MKYLPPARPKMIPKLKCSKFIEIWHIRYWKYPDLNFDTKNYFLSNVYQLLGQNWSQNKKCSEFIAI